ncbi:MAG: hypothetical protein ABT19_07070 [Rhodanobacter sp. SCN 68-63]|nr:MAG: hypothetical protein ABT19_07070 [Rhodanobacter sp. SCN 68-63]
MRHRFSRAAGRRLFLPCLAGVVWTLAGAAHAQTAAMDAQGKVVGTGDFRAQCVQVFENLRIALRSAGLGFNDVVRTDMYVTDLSQLAVLREVRARYLPAQAQATSTLLKVDGLFRPELMIEVAAEAVLPDHRAGK